MLPAAQIVNFERNISAISRRYRKEWRLSNEVVLDDAVAQVVRRRGLEDWDEMQLFLLAEVRQNGCWAIADCLVEKDSESDKVQRGSEIRTSLDLIVQKEVGLQMVGFQIPT